MKILGTVALAAVAALVLGFGARLGTDAPTAHADTTDVVVIGCELIVGAVDGSTVVAIDLTTPEGISETAAACGMASTALPPTCVPGLYADCPSIANLAKAIGDKDGKLEPADFRDDELSEDWDNNQLAEGCTAPGLTCSLSVFAFVNDEAPVTLDLPSGLTSSQSEITPVSAPPAAPVGGDFLCNADGVTITTDNDCAAGGVAGDGVVMFSVFNDTPGGAIDGDTKTARVIQETVEQSFDMNIVGSPTNVILTLAEAVIESNNSTANLRDCQTDVPVDDAISPPTSTLAIAQVYDKDDTVLTRVLVGLSIEPPGDIDDIAGLGVGDPSEGIVSDTQISIDVRTDEAPTAVYRVICGGRGTGTTTIRATIDVNPGVGVIEDRDEQELTVGGVPSTVTLTAAASTIKCDGSEKSTVTAKVTDSAGNPVAAGVPVNFSVVALGTASPINTTTNAEGIATSTITPLSNSSAGVTVVVTAGDDDIATVVQSSVRVDCALPLATQPVAAPTAATGRIGGPDTGSGGYLAQGDSAGFPMWTLVALALGSMTLVAGGTVARRAGK